MARKPADQSVSRDEIITAAADVLRENGYDATTMKDIAGRVNLTAASLYHHFKNKDFLLLAVLEVGLSAAIDKIETVIQANNPPPQKLRDMVHAHIGDVTDNPAVGAAMVFEIKSLMSATTAGRGNGNRSEFIERRDAFFKQRDYFENLFREVIQDGIENGDFRDVDAGIMAKTMLGAQNWVGVWYRSGGRLNGNEIAAMVAETFLLSLQPNS